MARLINSTDIGSAWDVLLIDLLTNGKEVSPREFKTLELENVSICIENGLNNILVNPIRDLNYRFMIAEWLWIWAGLNDVVSIAKYNKHIANFSDDGVIFNGAYGPRLKPQWSYIFESLRKPFSRQAVATIFTPCPKDSKDIPCSLTVQWLVRGNYLNCTVTMRSSDVWLGLPYDFFNFSQLTNIVAYETHKKVGAVIFNLGSSHLYESNLETAKKCLENKSSTVKSPLLKYLPSDDSIKLMLNGNVKAINAFPWDMKEPWEQYEDALLYDKHHALEVLRDISTK